MSKGLSVGRPTSGKSENVDHQGKKPALQQHFGKFGLLHALRNPEVHGKIGRWWNQPTNQPLLESFADWYHIPWLTNSLVCCQPPCHEVCGCFCWCDSGWTHMRYCLLERLGWSTCSTSGSARGVPSFLDLYKACWIKHTHYRLCWQFLTFLTIFMFLRETSWVPNKIDSFALKITAGWIRPCWASCFSTSWTSMGGDRNLSPCLWASFKCSSRMSYAAEWCWSETLESMNHLNGSKMLQGRTMLQNSSTRFKAAVSYRWRFEAVDRAAGRIKKIGKKKRSAVHHVSKRADLPLCCSPQLSNPFDFMFGWSSLLIEVLLFHRFFSTLTNFAVHPLTQVAPYLWLPVYLWMLV